MPLGHLYLFFGEMSRSSALLLIGLIFFYTECHELFVYFGDQSLVICFVSKYFLPFVACLFILFMVSFSVQKLLSLPDSCLFLFSFF